MTTIMMMMMVAEPSEKKKRIGKKNLQRIIFTHEVDLLEAIESQLQNLYLNTFQIIFYALCVLFHDSFAIRTDFVAQRACLPAHCPDARRVKAIDVDGGTHGVAWSRVKRGEENIQLYKIVFFPLHLFCVSYFTDFTPTFREMSIVFLWIEHHLSLSILRYIVFSILYIAQLHPHLTRKKCSLLVAYFFPSCAALWPELDSIRWKRVDHGSLRRVRWEMCLELLEIQSRTNYRFKLRKKISIVMEVLHSDRRSSPLSLCAVFVALLGGEYN